MLDITLLREAFDKLRHRPEFRANVLGGIAGVHFVPTKRDGYWLSHLHVLLELAAVAGGRFPRELRDAWTSMLGGRIHVKKTPVLFEADGACPMVAYIAARERESWLRFTPSQMDEAIRFVAGGKHRLVTTFGSWYGVAR